MYTRHTGFIDFPCLSCRSTRLVGAMKYPVRASQGGYIDLPWRDDSWVQPNKEEKKKLETAGRLKLEQNHSSTCLSRQMATSRPSRGRGGYVEWQRLEEKQILRIIMEGPNLIDSEVQRLGRVREVS